MGGGGYFFSDPFEGGWGLFERGTYFFLIKII